MQIFSSSYKSQAKMSRKIRCSVDIVRSGNLVQVRGCGIARNQETGSMGTFYFGLYCLELLKDLPVEDIFNICCSIICVVCASVCILCTILFILPFCHEHQFGLNSRIAAPKFCTKSRFYFLRRNLFEQFAPTLPKSKIA